MRFGKEVVSEVDAALEKKKAIDTVAYKKLEDLGIDQSSIQKPFDDVYEFEYNNFKVHLTCNTEEELALIRVFSLRDDKMIGAFEETSTLDSPEETSRAIATVLSQLRNAFNPSSQSAA